MRNAIIMAVNDLDVLNYITKELYPSIAMEQDRIMNRYGAWRSFERTWYDLSVDGHSVNVKAVFVDTDSEGTYSPFWCIRETIDGDEVNEYILTNDGSQS